MRRLVGVLLMVALVGCSGGESRPETSTTTTPASTSVTVASVAPTTPTVAEGPSSTSTTTADDPPGGESISVTEKITITITDPEDGG